MSIETLSDLANRDANTVEFDANKARETREYYHDAKRESDVCDSCNGDGLNHPNPDVPEIVEDEPCDECQGFS